MPVAADCAGTSKVLVCAIAGVAIATAQIVAEVARALRRSRYRIYSSPYERPDYSGSHGHDARERIFRFCRPNLFQFCDKMIRSDRISARAFIKVATARAKAARKSVV